MPDVINLANLAYLYTEKNAKEGMSPVELYKMYMQALAEIKAEHETSKRITDTSH